MSKKRGCTEELQRTPEGQHVLHVQTQERQAWIGGLWHMYLRGIEPSHGLSFSCVPAWGCNESVLGVSMATHRLMHCLASQFRHLRVCVRIESPPTGRSGTRVEKQKKHSSPKRCFDKARVYRYHRTVYQLGVCENTLQKQAPDGAQDVHRTSYA